MPKSIDQQYPICCHSPLGAGLPTGVDCIFTLSIYISNTQQTKTPKLYEDSMLKAISPMLSEFLHTYKIRFIEVDVNYFKTLKKNF